MPVFNLWCLSAVQGSAGGASSESSSSSSMAAIEQQLGVKPQDLMQRLMSRPDLLAKVQDPEVSMTPAARQWCYMLNIVLCHKPWTCASAYLSASQFP